MKIASSLALCAALALPALAADPSYLQSVEAWRAKAEAGLRKDNGWLTLAGRYPMKPGANTFGTAADNDIVFPPGLGPEHMGTVTVDVGRVTVKLMPACSWSRTAFRWTRRSWAPIRRTATGCRSAARLST